MVCLSLFWLLCCTFFYNKFVYLGFLRKSLWHEEKQGEADGLELWTFLTFPIFPNARPERRRQSPGWWGPNLSARVGRKVLVCSTGRRSRMSETTAMAASMAALQWPLLCGPFWFSSSFWSLASCIFGSAGKAVGTSICSQPVEAEAKGWRPANH